MANQARTNRVTTFAPGQTITVTWLETIQHPGWFRIALQPDGSNFSIPPAAAGPCITPNGGTVACPAGITNCAFPTVNQEGTDGPTGSIILADRIPDGTLSLDVTLPDIECTNCTLQFIQVMTDKCPYTVDVASDDIYFNCADLTISRNAPQQPDGGVPPDGGNPNNPDPGNPTTEGGCSTGVGAGLGSLVALLGLAIRRRRR